MKNGSGKVGGGWIHVRRNVAGVLCLGLLAWNAGAQMLESFEDWSLTPGTTAPAGWLKWQEAGGRGWSNTWVGRTPMPGWMSGTNEAPPDADAGSRMAYVTYTHGGAKTNDLWLITPTLKGMTATSTVSFWYRSSFSNFADSIRVHVSTNTAAYRKSDFTLSAFQHDFPRNWPNDCGAGVKCDFPPWTNITVDIGSLVPAGTDVRLGFQEYYYNNWYDVRANEMDVIRSDLWAEPELETTSVRLTDPTTVQVDYYAFPGYPTGVCYMGWSPDPYGMQAYQSVPLTPGSNTCVISNLPSGQTLYICPFTDHSRAGRVYGNPVKVQAGDSAGEGFLFESFEDWPLEPGQSAPAGWRKWEEAGGRGWSNTWVGRTPMPGWMSGTNEAPPDPDAGDRMAYVTYTHGGAKTNDLWLISPTIRNVSSNYTVSFWYRSSFSNFADSIRLHVSENTNAYRKSDFGIQAFQHDFPRNWPNDCGAGVKCDFPEWTNIVVDIGALVTPGSDVRLGFQEYYYNNWYDVRANEMDVIRGGDRTRQALRFDGTDDGVDLPLTNFPSAYTFEVWVKPDSIGAMNLMAEATSNAMATYNRQLRMTASGVFEHYVWDGAVQTVTGITVAQTGRWYHVCGTAADNGTMRLYVNGVEEGTAISVGTLLHSVADRVVVGRPAGGSFGAFRGAIDEIRIWTDIRTPTEILDSMNLYLRGIEDHLESCYRLDCTWGSDLFDSSQGGHDSWFGPAVDSYTWTHAARLYDGVDDEETLPQATAPPPGYTIEAWVRPQSTGARNILVLTDGDPTTSYNRQLRINAAGQAEFYAYDGATRLLTGTSVLPSNQWTHVAGTATNGGTMRLYVNGIEENSGAAGNTLWPTGTLIMVGTQTGAGFGWFKGRIRDVAVTNNVRSATELLATVSNGTWCATNQMPQWTEAETPLGDYVAARQWSNRGVWQARTNADAGRGLRLSSAVAAVTNFIVAGDNNLSGGTNAVIDGGESVGLMKRVWHLDVHGATQQVAELVFDPAAAGLTLVPDQTNEYLLLRCDSPTGTFAAVRTSADRLASDEVFFDAVSLDEGTYTLGLGPPCAPDVLSETNSTAYTFWANWGEVSNVTGYVLDVGTDETFSGYVPGYQNLDVGTLLTTAVTGLLPGVTYYIRVRSERDGVASTNSAVMPAVTLTEGAIGIDPAVLTFNCTYGTNPAAQTFVLTNSGETAYAYSNIVDYYSPGASGWLTAVPSGSVAAGGVVSVTAGVSAAGVNAGSYWATSQVLSATATNSPQTQFVSLTVTKADQTITFPAIGDKKTTNAVGLTATASSGLGMTFAVGAGPGSIAGGTNLTFTGAGSVSIVASQVGNSNWNAAADVTNTFNVTKAVAGVTLQNPAQDYDGTARTITATTVPAGLTVEFTYDGNTWAPTNVGTYAITGMVNDTMYQGSVTGALVVSKGDQVIAFPAIADQETTNAVGLTATASSGLGVTFVVGSGPASIAGGTNLTFTGAGSVSIVASQAGDSNWNMAADVTNTFNVTKAVAEVYLGDLSQVYDGTARTASATTMPAGLTVEFTYDGNTWAPTNAGTYAVTGTVNDVMYQGTATGDLVIARAQDTITFSNTNHVYDGTGKAATAVADSGSPVVLTYDGATNLPVNVGVYAVTGIVDAVNWEATNTTELTLAKGDQTITFPAIGAQETTNAVGLTATASSGLDVTFAVGFGSASIAGGTNLTFSTSGQVSVVASQAGDTNWNAAADVTNTFNVTKAVASVYLLDLSQVYDGTARTASATTMPAGLTVEITCDGSSSAPTDAGTYAVTGTVNDLIYQGISTGALVVAKADQTITFPAIADQETTNEVGLAATAGSSLPVSFAVASGPAAIAGGTNLTFSTSGQVSIAASQGGNSNWNAAADVTNTFNVTKAVAPVFLLDLSQVYDGTARTASATTLPAGLTVEFTYDGNVWGPTNAGSYAVTGTVSDLMYQGTATGDLVIARAQDTITFGATNQAYDGTGKAVTAVATSGSPVAVTYDGATNLPVNVGTYAVTGIVDVANWEATNTATLTIIKGDQTITNFLPPNGAQFILGSSTSVSAQASSGLAVGFENLTPETTLMSGTDVTFTNPGLARVRALQAGDANWNAAVPVTNEWRIGGLITNVVPHAANVGGGINVLIQGQWLGDGSDITTVLLAAVEATILTQTMNDVTVRAEAAPAAVTGDVQVVSGTGGSMILSNSFTYLWLDAPVQADPILITPSNLVARWQPVAAASTHYLDVALDTNFAAYHPGYEKLDVAMVEQYPVENLSNGVWYAIRQYAWDTNGYSHPSRTVWVPATTNTPYETHPPSSGPVSQGAAMEQAMSNLFCGAGMIYTATSSDSNVVAVGISPSGDLELDPVGPGTATITITATDPATGYTASYSFEITVVGEPAILSQDFLERELWNPRFTQVLEIRNDSGLDAIGVRVLFTNLMDGITVENQTGTYEDGRPMIETETTFTNGATMELNVVYLCTGAYRVDLYPATLELQYILPEWTAPLPGEGTIIGDGLPLSGGRYLLQFDSIIGRLYAIEYQNNFPGGDWEEVPLRLRATANRTQWIDAGPPATQPPEGLRIYRVKEIAE